jgi:hypothetical protein
VVFLGGGGFKNHPFHLFSTIKNSSRALRVAYLVEKWIFVLDILYIQNHTPMPENK